MKVCEICGDRGEPKDLVRCPGCRISVEHWYCFDVIAKTDQEKFAWRCEDCAPWQPKIFPAPSRKSERITKAAQDKLKMRKQSVITPVKAKGHVDGLPGKKQPLDEEARKVPELRKPKRKLILDDDEDENEMSKDQPSQLVLAVEDPPILVSAQPLDDPIWRGQFCIKNAKIPTSVGLVAHLSSKVCKRAHDASTSLPPCLDVEILLRTDVWPRSFQRSAPNDDTIALYFFPEYESVVKYGGLVDDMTNHDLAIKAKMKNTELLIFSSRELPSEYRRKLKAVSEVLYVGCFQDS